MRFLRYLTLFLLTVTALFAAPAKQTFSGTITDSMCDKADHSQMRMGPTDPECAMACIDVHGAEYGLYDGKSFFTLSDQQMPAKLVGKKVKVLGALDSKTKKIQVDSITVAK